MKSKIYLVTGAAGFLGGNVCHKLVSRGEMVRAFVLTGDPAADCLPPEVEIVYGDLVDKSSVEKLFDVPADTDIIVIHCASIVAISPEPTQLIYDVNVTGTKNVVDLCVENGVKKLVYVSSTGTIEELMGNQVMYEPTEFNPDTRIGYYAQTKTMATGYVLKSSNEHGLDASVVYPSGICGPYDNAYGPVAQVILKYCKGDMPSGIEGSFNAVDVRDLAEATIACVEKGRKGEGYILSNEMFSMRQLFEIIDETTGTKQSTVFLTGDEMKSATIKNAGGQLDDKALKALEFSIWNLERNNNFSSEKAEHELDYHPRSIHETISDSVKWLQSIGKI